MYLVGTTGKREFLLHSMTQIQCVHNTNKSCSGTEQHGGGFGNVCVLLLHVRYLAGEGMYQPLSYTPQKMSSMSSVTKGRCVLYVFLLLLQVEEGTAVAVRTGLLSNHRVLLPPPRWVTLVDDKITFHSCVRFVYVHASSADVIRLSQLRTKLRPSTSHFCTTTNPTAACTDRHNKTHHKNKKNSIIYGRPRPPRTTSPHKPSPPEPQAPIITHILLHTQRNTKPQKRNN